MRGHHGDRLVTVQTDVVASFRSTATPRFGWRAILRTLHCRAGAPAIQTWVRTEKLLFKKQVISVVSVVESALGLVRPALEAKSHPLRLEMSVTTQLLESDPVRVSQFLTNLPTV